MNVFGYIRVSSQGQAKDGYSRKYQSVGLVRQEVTIGNFTRYDIDFAKADELAPKGTEIR